MTTKHSRLHCCGSDMVAMWLPVCVRVRVHVPSVIPSSFAGPTRTQTQACALSRSFSLLAIILFLLFFGWVFRACDRSLGHMGGGSNFASIAHCIIFTCRISAHLPNGERTFFGRYGAEDGWRWDEANPWMNEWMNVNFFQIVGHCYLTCDMLLFVRVFSFSSSLGAKTADGTFIVQRSLLIAPPSTIDEVPMRQGIFVFYACNLSKSTSQLVTCWWTHIQFVVKPNIMNKMYLFWFLQAHNSNKNFNNNKCEWCIQIICWHVCWTGSFCRKDQPSQQQQQQQRKFIVSLRGNYLPFCGRKKNLKHKCQTIAFNAGVGIAIHNSHYVQCAHSGREFFDVCMRVCDTHSPAELNNVRAIQKLQTKHFCERIFRLVLRLCMRYISHVYTCRTEMCSSISWECELTKAN